MKWNLLSMSSQWPVTIHRMIKVDAQKNAANSLILYFPKIKTLRFLLEKIKKSYLYLLN